jgi:hypothetical protein
MTNEENNEEQKQPLFNPELPEGIEDNNTKTTPESEIVTLEDGTQILTAQGVQEDEEEVVDPKEQLTDEDLQKLVHFTTGVKDLSQEELDSLRNDDKELERLLRISMIKARKLTYNPKKDFGKAYKKKRQRKNKLTKASKRANR